MSVVVATANVQETLGSRDAAMTLEQVLAQSPDVVGLQEWYPRRWPLLSSSGPVRSVPGGLRLPRSGGDGRLTWCAGLVGGCVVGVRRDRFDVEACSAHVLNRPGRADRAEGGLGLEAARVAVVSRCRDRASGASLAFVGYHLVHGVQRAGAYREDRPRLVSRHRREVDRLVALVELLRDEGRVVHAFGDSNFDGFRLPPLVSAWSVGDGATGTLGPRRVDDVHAPTAPASVTSVETRSDHRAVIARYDDVV